MTSVPSGVSSGIMNRLRGAFVKGTAQTISTGSSAGQEVVYKPPTIAPPPSATAAVMQQLNTSTQLAENTATGSGIGAGGTSAPITVSVVDGRSLWIIGGLGFVLLLAYLVDKGKL